MVGHCCVAKRHELLAQALGRAVDVSRRERIRLRVRPLGRRVHVRGGGEDESLAIIRPRDAVQQMLGTQHVDTERLRRIGDAERDEVMCRQVHDQVRHDAPDDADRRVTITQIAFGYGQGGVMPGEPVRDGIGFSAKGSIARVVSRKAEPGIVIGVETRPIAGPRGGCA